MNSRWRDSPIDVRGSGDIDLDRRLPELISQAPGAHPVEVGQHQFGAILRESSGSRGADTGQRQSHVDGKVFKLRRPHVIGVRVV